MKFLWPILLDRRRLTVALLLLAGAARAQEVACRAVLAGTRALVDATVHGLLDRDLLRVVKLGLAGRLTVETTVVRRRHLWFGRVVSRTTRDLPLVWSEERGRVAGLLSSDSDSALSRTVLSAIANDLVRSTSTTCPVEPRR